MYFKINKETDIKSPQYDGIVYVCTTHVTAASDGGCSSSCGRNPLASAVCAASKYDPTVTKTVSVLPLESTPAGRIVVAATGKIDADYDDVRSFRDAASKGIKKALDVGIKRPLLYLQEYPEFKDSDLVTLLGALEALHVPIQIRELKPGNLPTIEQLGVIHSNPSKLDEILSLAKALEAGRVVARDIGDADPERMAPPRVRQYVEEQFKETCIKISVIDNEKTIADEYPLFEAVNRCASVVDRHKGCIMYLEYDPGTIAKETLLFVGKGVTYDTGGADIKAGGIMAGMSRDKCGAAAVAGLMKVVAELKPKNVKVIAALCLVRNSVGSNCYVADELIKARSGQLVRIGNTDAEGRMIMADVLCRMKELAVDVINPQLFTIATLTGHACLTVGDGYSIAVDNGPARKAGVSGRLQMSGDVMGDPFEISTMRREDLRFHRGKIVGDDIMQCSNAASSRTARGHQGPAAFLLLASGLDQHGSDSAVPIKYTHLDIASSGGNLPDPCTGAPILALAKAFFIN